VTPGGFEPPAYGLGILDRRPSLSQISPRAAVCLLILAGRNADFTPLSTAFHSGFGSTSGSGDQARWACPKALVYNTRERRPEGLWL